MEDDFGLEDCAGIKSYFGVKKQGTYVRQGKQREQAVADAACVGSGRW
ncbi:MAG: hypothetical protein ACKV0T_12480 [Planctomycetales bacterium]